MGKIQLKKRKPRPSRAPAGIRSRRPRSRPSRRRADAALAASEARFRALAEAGSDWLWETDAEDRYTWFGGAIERQVGYPPERYIGRTRTEVAAAGGVDVNAELWKSHMETIARREPFRDLRQRRVSPKGEIWLSVSGAPRFDDEGRFLGYRAAVSTITAQIESEQRTQESNRRLSAAIEHLNESIAVVDADDRIVVANRRFRALNGGTRLAEPGYRYEEHLRAGIALGNYPEAIGREEAWLEERLSRHRRGGTDEVKRQDGQWLLVTDQRLPDGGMITFALDITERKHAEEALRQSEARFHSLADLSSDWYWEQDADLRFVSTTGRASGRGGITAADHTGKRRWELPGTEIVNQSWAEHQATLAAHLPFRDVMLKRTAADGAIHYVGISGEPMFNEQGAFSGYRGIARDVTERVVAENQARAADERLHATLRDTNEELERRVAERTAALRTAYSELESFSYSVSHDLRSPLGVIASFAGILARQEAGRISEDGMRLVSVIDENAQRMGRLIDALLELMRMSRRALVFRRLDIAGIAGATCRELQRDYPQARIEIGELPVTQGDEMLVQQVYANLIGNALKFSSKGAAPHVELGAEQSGSVPVYFVRDNGAGFDKDHAAKLFKPFERLHSEHEFPGTGIGLALVHLIVQRHGGRIWAESAPGRGSTFRFTLAGGGSG